MQEGAIKAGQTVIVIDDLIATGPSTLSLPSLPLLMFRWDVGGSAMAAGELVTKCGGTVLEYLFSIELEFLKGTAKLNAPSYSIVKD